VKFNQIAIQQMQVLDGNEGWNLLNALQNPQAGPGYCHYDY
jgi:hypothetical protein